MDGNKKKELKSVKIGASFFLKVKDQKKITGIPIATFIEKSIDEKLAREAKLKK